AAQALNYATEHRVRLSLNAWDPGMDSPAWLDAVKTAQQAGDLVIQAAGNDNPAVLASLAQYHTGNVIVVGSSDANHQLAAFSNADARIVDIAAPGVDITGRVLGGRLEAHSGTSVSTALVTGAVALL